MRNKGIRVRKGILDIIFLVSKHDERWNYKMGLIFFSWRNFAISLLFIRKNKFMQ